VRLVIASEDAGFKDAPHLLNGLAPGDGMQIVWPRLLGLNRAKYFLFTGQEIDAKTALALGVVNEVLPKEEVPNRAWELARQLLEYPRLARRFAREVMNQELKEAMVSNLGGGLALEGLGAQIFASGGEPGDAG
jgi:enoyl-CoA hydratase/carnithine racemase